MVNDELSRCTKNPRTGGGFNVFKKKNYFFGHSHGHLLQALQQEPSLQQPGVIPQAPLSQAPAPHIPLLPHGQSLHTTLSHNAAEAAKAITAREPSGEPNMRPPVGITCVRYTAISMAKVVRVERRANTPATTLQPIHLPPEQQDIREEGEETSIILYSQICRRSGKYLTYFNNIVCS